MNKKTVRKSGVIKSLFEVIIGLVQKRKFKKISASEFLELTKSQKDITIIDCRDKNDFALGHVKNAINIPYQGFMKKWNNVPKEKTVVTICYLGIYGRAAAQKIANTSNHTVYTVIGGMKAIDNLDKGIGNY